MSTPLDTPTNRSRVTLAYVYNTGHFRHKTTSSFNAQVTDKWVSPKGHQEED